MAVSRIRAHVSAQRSRVLNPRPTAHTTAWLLGRCVPAHRPTRSTPAVGAGCIRRSARHKHRQPDGSQRLLIAGAAGERPRMFWCSWLGCPDRTASLSSPGSQLPWRPAPCVLAPQALPKLYMTGGCRKRAGTAAAVARTMCRAPCQAACCLLLNWCTTESRACWCCVLRSCRLLHAGRAVCERAAHHHAASGRLPVAARATGAVARAHQPCCR